MNRHSKEGAGSSVPSTSKNAPTASAPVPGELIALLQSQPHDAEEVSVPQHQKNAAPPTPPARPAPRKKPPQPPLAFVPQAKAHDAHPRPANPPANAPQAAAIPNNKNTRTSESRKQPGFHATPPAPAPTNFPASNHRRIRCAPRAPPPRAENQSAPRAQKIKPAATM